MRNNTNNNGIRVLRWVRNDGRAWTNVNNQPLASRWDNQLRNFWGDLLGNLFCKSQLVFFWRNPSYIITKIHMPAEYYQTPPHYILHLHITTTFHFTLITLFFGFVFVFYFHRLFDWRRLCLFMFLHCRWYRTVISLAVNGPTFVGPTTYFSLPYRVVGTALLHSRSGVITFSHINNLTDCTENAIVITKIILLTEGLP